MSMDSSTARMLVQVAEAVRIENEFMDSDKFTSLEDLKEKINTEMPRNYRISLDKDAIEKNRQFLTLFTYEPVLGLLPAMANVLRIGETGSFVMVKDGIKIANSKLRHILHGHRVVFTRVSQVTNALAFLNNYSVDETDKCPADITVEDLHPEKHDPLHFKQEEDSEMLYIKQEAKPETPNIKEEEQKNEIPKFPVTVSVKSEENEGRGKESGARKPSTDSSFQHRTTKDEGRSQPDGFLAPLSESDDVTSHSSDFNTNEEDFDFDQNSWKSFKKSSLKRKTKRTVGKPFPCSTCNKRFSWKTDLERHMHTHTERFTEKGYLNKHTETHNREKPFACSLCDKRYVTKANLIVHTRTHTGDKPFPCTLCDKRFSQKNDLERHKRTHTGEKPFVCTCCGKGFTDKGKLKRHTSIYTGEKPFACTLCKRRFSLNCNLKKHQLTHTGEKPFVCTSCGKRFAEKGNLKKHAITHTGEKPFACSFCEKRFWRKNEMTRHTLTHT
ncbi:gastrula zinc finger protein XlCGF26.1-like isoform X2 [Corythoichthys intestinalis]|nr:gastrula zinc finger protein XlCGF26.1-like isoform X2 [Corythoichthys intestinalis]